MNWKESYPLNTLKGETRKEFEVFIDVLLFNQREFYLKEMENGLDLRGYLLLEQKRFLELTSNPII